AYLRYNKPPAKIFMGDAGATFLGFILAVIALDGAFKQATVISLFIPILALGVPIFDNLFVVVRRMLQGKAIYQADASQAHYRLLRAGLSHKQVVMFLCLISTCLCLSSIILLLVQIEMRSRDFLSRFFFVLCRMAVSTCMLLQLMRSTNTCLLSES